VCLGLDLVGLADLKIEFTLGKPFFPYQQLLGVLPIASKHCLPPPYQELMTATTSPLAGSYPEDFALDTRRARSQLLWPSILVPLRWPSVDSELSIIDARHLRCYPQLCRVVQRRRIRSECHSAAVPTVPQSSTRSWISCSLSNLPVVAPLRRGQARRCFAVWNGFQVCRDAAVFLSQTSPSDNRSISAIEPERFRLIHTYGLLCIVLRLVGDMMIWTQQDAIAC
jgi:hypothetical protein